MGYPLHRHKDEKWGYLVPFGKQDTTEELVDDDDECQGPMS